jgi:hypothetical protein
VPKSSVASNYSHLGRYPESSGLKTLFKHAKGRILASASIRGRTSFGSNNGGWFTNAFLLSLQKETQRSHQSWKHLLKRAKKLLNRHNQFPQFALDLH